MRTPWRCGAHAHTETARQDGGCARAPLPDARAHGVPDARGHFIGVGARSGLVRCGDLCDCEARVAADSDQFVKSAEAVWKRDRPEVDRQMCSHPHHEAPADRQEGLPPNELTIIIRRFQVDCVCVVRVTVKGCKLEVSSCHRDPLPCDVENRIFPQIFPQTTYVRGVARLRPQAEQAGDDRVGCAVPETCGSERTAQSASDSGDGLELLAVHQHADEGGRRSHRADSMRTRWADTDGKHFTKWDIGRTNGVSRWLPCCGHSHLQNETTART